MKYVIFSALLMAFGAAFGAPNAKTLGESSASQPSTSKPSVRDLIKKFSDMERPNQPEPRLPTNLTLLKRAVKEEASYSVVLGVDYSDLKARYPGKYDNFPDVKQLDPQIFSGKEIKEGGLDDNIRNNYKILSVSLYKM